MRTGAREFHLGGEEAPLRPDTLKQTDQPPSSTNPLADGRAILFQVISWRSKYREITDEEKRSPQLAIRRSWISNSVRSGWRRMRPSR